MRKRERDRSRGRKVRAPEKAASPPLSPRRHEIGGEREGGRMCGGVMMMQKARTKLPWSYSCCGQNMVFTVIKGDQTKWKSETTENAFHWTTMMNGPPNSPYAGGVFRFKINFGPDYPFKPPQVALVTPIFHPNFGTRNGLELKLISTNYWSPATTMSETPKILIQTLPA